MTAILNNNAITLNISRDCTVYPEIKTSLTEKNLFILYIYKLPK